MIFRRYDEDDGGTIDCEELSKAFSDMDKDELIDKVPELLTRFGAGEGAEEVTFAEFVTMVFETEKETRRAEAKAEDTARRKAKEAENKVFVRFVPPAASCRDAVLTSAVNRAAKEAEQAALDALDALLAAGAAGQDTGGAEKAGGAAHPDWNAVILTPWDPLPKQGGKGGKGNGSDRSESPSKKKRGKGGSKGTGGDDDTNNDEGSLERQNTVDVAGAQPTANEQVCRLVRCAVGEQALHEADEALRQLIVSRATRNTIDAGFQSFDDPKVMSWSCQGDVMGRD